MDDPPVRDRSAPVAAADDWAQGRGRSRSVHSGTFVSYYRSDSPEDCTIVVHSLSNRLLALRSRSKQRSCTHERGLDIRPHRNIVAKVDNVLRKEQARWEKARLLASLCPAS